MASEKRSYYRRGKTRLDDRMSSALIEAIEEQADKLAKDGKEAQIKQFLRDIVDPIRLSGIADRMAEDIVKKSRKDVRKAVRFESKQKLGFEKRLYKSYQKSIDAYLELLGISLEAIDNHRKITHDNLGEKDAFLPFLLRLHARVYRNANEILALMRSGYGSGAIARWRSMHETTVVLAYAKEKGPPIIKFMEDHAAVSSYKSMKVFQEHAEALGQKPFSSYEIRLARAKYDRRLNKYGSHFKSDYGWVWAASGHTLNNFRDLEQHVGIDHLYPYYRHSSLSIHMEWRSLMVGEEFEALNDPGIALVGPADYGFEEAVSLSLLTLAYATILILTYNLSYESMVYAKVIMSVEQRAQELFEQDFTKVKDIYDKEHDN